MLKPMRDHVDVVLQIGADGWLSFKEAARIIRADSIEAVRPALADVERVTRDYALHAVGFVAYEAGLAFGIPTRRPDFAHPIVWFAAFEPANVRQIPPPRGTEQSAYRLGPLAPSVDRPRFGAAFDQIKRHLRDGDSYQVNFTFKMRGPFDGDPWELFTDLVEAQQGRHAAFIRTGDWSICSASPELFFELDGLSVRTRPMKGTGVRGRTLDEDRANCEALRHSAKQRAENVMIVDMARNDLGKIAEMGSVDAPELFAVERYPNVWQMTSLVTARSTASLQDIFAALHPAASVTGAPKVRTAQILSELEGGARGVYTGAIGHVRPDGNGSFNVAIRTAFVDHRAGTVEFGIGSGIVWDSDPAAEYEECLLKGAILGRRAVHFDLLETMRWRPDEGIALLHRHLSRLRDSAEYFSFRCDLAAVQVQLARAVEGLVEPCRIRLLLARDGTARIERTPLLLEDRVLRVGLAPAPVQSRDVSLFHKTTNREVYDRARAAVPTCDDVVMWNERGEVTEATNANVIVELAGRRWTPPVGCGLLAGTLRAELLAAGELGERVVTLDELRAASRIWLINSVRGERAAELI
jgi:para-aminobenzoate synthetase/4-amino-4-deoxychorismate lyase